MTNEQIQDANIIAWVAAFAGMLTSGARLASDADIIARPRRGCRPRWRGAAAPPTPARARRVAR